MEKIKVFEFQGKQVEFDLTKINMMVNATEMATIYGRDVKDFNKLESTKGFIETCLNGEFSSPLGLQSKDDLIISKPRTGTWMHRVLALKFAAWLDPNFEVWVFCTIEKIMFGTMREDALKKAKYEKEMDNLHQKLLVENPDYARMMNLEDTAKEIGGKIKKQQRTQLSLMLEDSNN